MLDIFNQAPGELRLKKSGNSPRADGTALSLNPSGGASGGGSGGDRGNGTGTGVASFDPAGYTRHALAELNNLFDNPNANREDASNAYLVMQANIHVTQVSLLHCRIVRAHRY